MGIDEERVLARWPNENHWGWKVFYVKDRVVVQWELARKQT
jgi:fructosamine-3-kinase